jgi:hypothetical protein
MRAIEPETFPGHGGPGQVELPKPQPAKGAIVERVYALPEAGAALRHPIEDRPLGKVVLRS